MIYGYARVSTTGQRDYGNGLEAQKQALLEAGCAEENIFSDAFTGTKIHRPGLDKLLSLLKCGDTLVVTKLDRIARSTVDGIATIQPLLDAGVAVNILNMGVMDNTPTGRLTMHIFMAFAEFERDMIVARTQEGKAVARQDPNYREGRPRKEARDKAGYAFEEYLGMVERRECTRAEACKALGISERTFFNRKKELRK